MKRCKYCGSELGKDEIFCTVCGKTVKGRRDKKSKKEKDGKKKSKKAVIIIIVALIAALIIAFIGLAHLSVYPFCDWYYAMLNVFKKDEPVAVEFNSDEIKQTAEEYYENRSEIESSVPLAESENAKTEAEFAEEISERGFEKAYMFYEYDAEGNAVEDGSEVNAGSAVTHPILEAFVYLDDESIWHIYEIEGAYTAFPVSYINENEIQIPIIVSESNEIVSYDAIGQKFYRTIPDEDKLKVIVIDKITADSLMNTDISAEVQNDNT